MFARYFGKFNKARQDRWVFGDQHTGGYLHRLDWTNIVRLQIRHARRSSLTRSRLVEDIECHATTLCTAVAGRYVRSLRVD